MLTITLKGSSSKYLGTDFYLVLSFWNLISLVTHQLVSQTQQKAQFWLSSLL